MNRSGEPGDLIRCLRDGGVALMATDTLPGFHARIDAPDALARIAALKGRDSDKPMLTLAASLEAAGPWLGSCSSEAIGYAGRCWPGPITLVLPAGVEAPPAVTASGGTMAVRVPEPEPLRSVLAALAVPLVSTSVNRAGEPPARDIDEAAERFGDAVDLVADGDWGRIPDPDPAPSTIVDLSTWPPRTLRVGGVAPPDWSDDG